MIKKLSKFNFFFRTKMLLRNRNYNFYEVLGVSQDCTNEQIKAAYIKLAKEYHPDINKSEGAEDKFKSITVAYEALNNQRNRDLYDAYMYSDPYSDNTYDFFKDRQDDPFDNEKARWEKFNEKYKGNKKGGFWGEEGKEEYEKDFFKDFENIFSGGYKTKTVKGEDILVEIKISLEDSFHGATKGININNKREICSKCKGSKSMPGYRPSKCFSCGGTGEGKTGLFGGSKCKMCKGQGYLIKNPCT